MVQVSTAGCLTRQSAIGAGDHPLSKLIEFHQLGFKELPVN
jgi:hypothetical protein